MSRRKITEEFIEEARQIHGDKYDYSLVEYKNVRTKVKIICPKHGLFEQNPDKHLRGNGCKLCGYERTSKKFLKTTEKFIKEAKEIHGDKYDYSKVNYKNNKTKIEIICPVHGSFFQRPIDHLSGSGCISCRKTTEEFIKEAKQIHGDKYDYSLVEYKHSKNKIKITCLKHGVFEQTPNAHLHGYGCPVCSGNIKYNTKQFIEKAIQIHGDKYDYSLVEYEVAHNKIKIICPEHGVFEQFPYSHLQGVGCPICSSSKGENKIIQELEKHNIKYIKEKRFEECRDKIPLPFDFYLPEYNVLIEFDGKQHFEINEFFGGEKYLTKIKLHDKIKNKFAKENEIKLVRIPYWKMNNIGEIIEESIINR